MNEREAGPPAPAPAAPHDLPDNLQGDTSSRPEQQPWSGSRRFGALFKKDGNLEPFRLLRQDLRNVRQRYLSDWTVFNQLVLASAVYVFFTNILPGITFASDLYVLTGKSWGTIEVVLSTGLCGIIFALCVSLSNSSSVLQFTNLRKLLGSTVDHPWCNWAFLCLGREYILVMCQLFPRKCAGILNSV